MISKQRLDLHDNIYQDLQKSGKSKNQRWGAIGYATGVLMWMIYLDITEEQKKAIEEAIRRLEEVIIS